MFRFSITIHKSAVKGSHTNYTYLFSEGCANIPAGFWSHVSDAVSGLDIRFYNTDKTTELKRENVFFDKVNSKIEAWVQVPSGVNDVNDKIIYCQYGGPTKANDYDIWSAIGAAAVYHYQDDAADSSPNANDGTPHGVDFLAGKIGKGSNFERANSDWIDVPNDPALVGMDDFAISSWVKITSKDSGGIPFACVWNNGPTQGMMVFGAWDGPNRTIFYLSHTGAYQPAGDYTHAVTLNDGTWYHLAFVKTGGYVVCYKNGVPYDTIGDFIAQLYNSPLNLRMGAPADTSYWNYYDGMLDELRIHGNGGVPNADWIQTEYNNQNDPATFSEASIEENFGQNYGFTEFVFQSIGIHP